MSERYSCRQIMAAACRAGGFTPEQIREKVDTKGRRLVRWSVIYIAREWGHTLAGIDVEVQRGLGNVFHYHEVARRHVGARKPLMLEALDRTRRALRGEHVEPMHVDLPPPKPPKPVLVQAQPEPRIPDKAREIARATPSWTPRALHLRRIGWSYSGIARQLGVAQTDVEALFTRRASGM